MTELDSTDVDVAALLGLGGDKGDRGRASSLVGEKLAVGAIYVGTAVCIGVFAISHFGSLSSQPAPARRSASIAPAPPVNAYTLIVPAAPPVRAPATPYAPALAVVQAPRSAPVLRTGGRMRVRSRAYATLTARERREIAIARERRFNDEDVAAGETLNAQAYVREPRAYAYVTSPPRFSRRNDVRFARAERLEALDAIWFLRQR